MEIVKGADKTHGSGFTLIEMILAISIFSMVIAVVFSSFRVGLGAWQKGEDNIEFYQRVRAVSDFLYRQISSTFPYKVTPGLLDTHREFFAFFGKPDSLEFVSYANINGLEGGLSLLEIWVNSNNELMIGHDVALVSNISDLKDINLRDEDKSFLISPDVERLQFRYFDREKEDEEGQWIDSWDPKDKRKKLPLFVEVTIIFKDKHDEQLKNRLVVPIVFMEM